MSILQQLIQAGTSITDSRSAKRNITLTNNISMIVTTAPLLLVIGVLLFSKYDSALIFRLLIAALLFIVPLCLNMFGYTSISRIALCWFPQIAIFAISVIDVHNGSAMSASSFVGLRLYLLTTTCFPFLVFDLKEWGKLSLGLSASLLSLLWFDTIFSFFHAAYWQHGTVDPLYSFNDIRALIGFLVISLSCYFLKRNVEQNEKMNEILLAELEQKNKTIREQAADEVHQLNQQLLQHVKQLEQREFSLNQSQKTAKIGNWEYRIKDAWLFCSDEIYNIFGLDRDFDFRTENLSEIIQKEDSEVLTYATDILLKTGKAFDISLRAKTPFGYTKWIRINASSVKEDGKISGVRGVCYDITYFREAEEMLRISESKYRSLFEQASDFIMITDFNGRFLDANESCCTAFGYSREEILQMKVDAVIDPNDLSGKPIDFGKIMSGEHILSERKMIRRDGTVILVEANIRKIQEARILVIARDVTTLRDVQRQIALSEALFRSAFEDSAIGMALVSPEHRWIKVNKELCEITGYSDSELLGQSVRDFTYSNDFDQDHALIEQLLEGDIETYQREKRYVHKSGSLVWANVNASVVKDEHATPLYLVLQIEDITIEKKAQEKLLLSQANLTATINNTEVFIWSVDLSLRLLMFNDPFFNYIKRHYGVEIKIGVRVFGEDPAISDAMLEKWQPRFDRVFNGESFILEETRFEIDFQYSLSPIMKSGVVVGVSVIADNVTERKARDRELAEANKKISELKLMALRAVMSPHFIFNVLNSIQYYITKSDRYNAINYLSMFSRLMRTILTHSVDSKIHLADEIEMLSNYVRLEMTRFENKFNFLLMVDPDVEADSIQIPSLLIQPYVENALLHGLYNKKTRGTLTIRIRQDDTSVMFEIEDDGIGREAARKIKEHNFPSHKSMGIRITEERLKLINQEQHTSLRIDDLMEGDVPSGTKVTIRINIS